MDCGDCLDRLYAYLDKELGPVELGEVAKHLAGCEDCLGDFDFEDRFLKIIRDCGTSDVAPEDLRRRVTLRLRGGAPPLA